MDAERLKQLSHITIEQAMDGIFWLDSQGRIHRANEAACRLFGYSSDELLNLTIADIDRDVDAEGYQRFWERLEKEKKVSFESCHTRKGGQTYPVVITSYYVAWPDQEGTDYCCSFFRDMTGSRQAKQALKESEERFRSTFELAPVGVAHVTLDGKWLQVNQTLCELTGYTLKELPRITIPDITHPDDKEETLQYVNKMIAGRIKNFSLEKRLLHKNGSHLFCHVSVSLKRDEQGTPEYMIAVIEDISSRKKAEDALHHTLAELESLKNRLEKENLYLQEEILVEHNFEEIIGRSEVFKKVLRKVEQVAHTKATVLISGETGTGKELIARAVHNLSNRESRPLVKVNCAALPATLIESELFGHEKGAFTGALIRKIGRFELADNGTIFLDEIGDLPLDLQAKLLRVLQEGEFERLGSIETMTVDVRVIAATNRNLKKLMKQGLFREDLYYRLNVFPIECPALRERNEDIPDLVSHFTAKYITKTGSSVTMIPQNAMQALKSYRWPGNVRELENIIERALIISRGKALELEDWLLPVDSNHASGKMATLEENEKRHIRKTLELTGGRVSGEKGAAKLLNINSKTLRSRMVKLGMINKS